LSFAGRLSITKYALPTDQQSKEVRSIMRSTATIAIAVTERQAGTVEPLTDLWSNVSARFLRFIEKLPERYEDVDPEVFKRVPVPI